MPTYTSIIPASLSTESKSKRLAKGQAASKQHAAQPHVYGLKLFLFPEEHRKTDNRPINQQPTNNTHHHRLDPNQIAVSQHDW